MITITGWLLLGLLVGLLPLEGNHKRWETVLYPVIGMSGAALGGWAHWLVFREPGGFASMISASCGAIVASVIYRSAVSWVTKRP